MAPPANALHERLHVVGGAAEQLVAEPRGERGGERDRRPRGRGSSSRECPARSNSAVAEIDSGRLEMKTATMNETLTPPPETSVRPIAADSGIPSSSAPSTMPGGVVVAAAVAA